MAVESETEGCSTVIDPDLLPDFAHWLAVNPGESINTYVWQELKPEHFFAVAELLSPALTFHNGGVFLRDGFNEAHFQNFFSQTEGNLTAVERVMNHRHVRDIAKSFDNCPLPLLCAIGKAIKVSLEARLQQVMPDIAIIVELFRADDDVQLTFYCQRDEPAVLPLRQESRL